MKDILSIDGWKGNTLIKEYEDTSLKYLNSKASELHNAVDAVNEAMPTGKYVIHTKIMGYKKKHYYTLHVLIRYLENGKKHEHKENTHREEINI